MRLHRPARKLDGEARILPLINVVFLLLIFFMLAGRLAASDPFQISPPASDSEGLAARHEFVVLVGADGRLALDNREIQAEALQDAVAERMAANRDAKVRLKADGEAAANDVVGVMELLRDAGVERLKLLTVPQDRGGG
jgi:biopolymer transport protein ExbD